METRPNRGLPGGAPGPPPESESVFDSASASVFEAVPNFSEGRSIETIAQLEAAARPLLLDTHTDASHHRSVFTLAGPAEPLAEAVLRLFEAALATIDIREHWGEHPRIGALDVLPIVPLGGAPMEDAVSLARSLGAEIAERGNVPVFFYGHADPNGRTLPEIRRGGLDELSARMERGEIAPDHGPVGTHPTAGAIAIGARAPLIAFNINLNTGDVEVARRIASRIRTSSGGMPELRAIGVRQQVPEPGFVLAQVSMNLLDWRRTGLAEVFARVRAEAEGEGTDIAHSEIVGLIPEAAAWEGMTDDLRLRDPPRTIEAVYADTARAPAP